MSANLNGFDDDLTPAKAGHWLPAAWAFGASLALHGLGVGGLILGGISAIEPAELQETSHILQAGIIPAQLIEATATSLQAQTPNQQASLVNPTGFAMQAVPITKPKQKAKPENTVNIAPIKTAPAADRTLEPKTSPEPPPAPQTVTDSPTVSEPVTAAASTAGAVTDVAPTPQTAPTPAPTINPATPVASNSAVSPAAPSLVAAQTTTAAAVTSYRLPQRLTVRFEATVRGFAGKSVLSWKKSNDLSDPRYEAQLLSTVAIPFKTYEHRLKSAGVINKLGLAPLNVEEKRANGKTVATTVEPDKNRVIISSKEGFLPYDPQAHDLVSLIVQLAINAQSNPQWQQSGTAQDFTVYRPSGIKRWRFQSMGFAAIALAEKTVQTLHLRRVPIGGEPDFEDTYHFWLDLNRYGFPVKMRQTDKNGNHTDILMAEWQES